jgi:hypothetical protein
MQRAKALSPQTEREREYIDALMLMVLLPRPFSPRAVRSARPEC